MDDFKRCDSYNRKPKPTKGSSLPDSLSVVFRHHMSVWKFTTQEALERLGLSVREAVQPLPCSFCSDQARFCGCGMSIKRGPQGSTTVPAFRRDAPRGWPQGFRDHQDPQIRATRGQHVAPRG